MMSVIGVLRMLFGREFWAEDESKNRAIITCCLAVCRSIDKRHGVLYVHYGFFCNISEAYDCTVLL